MALYGIALLPLAEILRERFPDVLQPWYADDAAMQGRPARVAACFKLLCDLGPHFGYFPEPEKSFAICPLATEVEVKAAFEAEGMTVKTCRGHRYVGGYVGSLAMRNRWIEPMVEEWVAGIEVLSKIARKFPQSAYHGFATLLQAEWQYLCRCVPGVGRHLSPVEEAIKTLLIPALLELPVDHVQAELRTLLSHGVKAGG